MSRKTKVHLCRFTEYLPAAVCCAEVSPCEKYVVVGRENGDVELICTVQRFRTIARIGGKANLNLRALCWCRGSEKNDRVIGCSLSGTVFELDFVNLCYKNIRDSYGGAVWCMSMDYNNNRAAVGCEDGSVKIFTCDGDGLEYVMTFLTCGKRILSIVWSRDGEHIFSGDCNSTIRAYKQSGQLLYHMTAEKVKRNATDIWSLRLLSDGSLISGDSVGNTQVWDTSVGTLLQTLRTHQADVLALAISRDEQMIFASGVDCRIVQLMMVEDTVTGVKKWTYSKSVRPHTHDVKTLQCLTLKTGNKTTETLLSGAVDTSVYITDVDDFSRVKSKKIWPMPYHQVCSLASSAGILSVAHGNMVSLWKLERIPNDSERNEKKSNGKKPPKSSTSKMCVIRSRNEYNLQCACISPNGKFLAFSSQTGTNLFHLSEKGEKIKVKKVKVHRRFTRPCHRLVFTSDGSHIIQGHANGCITVTKMPDPTESTKKKIRLVTVSSYLLEPTEGTTTTPLPCTHLQVSQDGTWAVTGNSSGELQIYSLEIMKHTWAPSLGRKKRATGVTGIGFVGKSSLLAIFDVFGGQRVIDVARHMEANMSNLPRSGGILWMGLACNPGNERSAIIYNHMYISHMKIRHFGEQESGKKRKRGADNDADAGGRQIFRREKELSTFSPQIFVKYMGPDELVVVECPWTKINQSLPGTLARKKYGT